MATIHPEQQQTSKIVRHVGNEKDDSLHEIDMRFRYFLVVIGAMPAYILPHLTTRIKVVVLIIQLCLCLLFVVTSIYAITLVMQSTENMASLLYNVLAMMLLLLTPLQWVTFLVGGAFFNRYGTFYDQLNTLQDRFIIHGIPRRTRLLKKTVACIHGYGCIAALSFLVMVAYDHFESGWNFDPFFKVRLFGNSTIYIWETSLNYAGVCHFAFTGVYLIFRTTYAVNVLLEIIILAREFNRHIKSRIEEDADQLYNDLGRHRHTHLELCGLVDEANKLFRFYLACEVTLYSVGLLILLYTVSIGLTEEGGLRGLLSFWCATFALIAAMLVFICHHVKEKTTEPRGHLLSLSQKAVMSHADPSEQQRQMFQFNLFMEQVGTPTSLTMAELINIDKDLGLTIVGFLMTYYLLMAQIHSASQSTCNCPDISNSTL